MASFIAAMQTHSPTVQLIGQEPKRVICTEGDESARSISFIWVLIKTHLLNYTSTNTHTHLNTHTHTQRQTHGTRYLVWRVVCESYRTWRNIELSAIRGTRHLTANEWTLILWENVDRRNAEGQGIFALFFFFEGVCVFACIASMASGLLASRSSGETCCLLDAVN